MQVCVQRITGWYSVLVNYSDRINIHKIKWVHCFHLCFIMFLIFCVGCKNVIVQRGYRENTDMKIQLGLQWVFQLHFKFIYAAALTFKLSILSFHAHSFLPHLVCQGKINKSPAARYQRLDASHSSAQICREHCSFFSARRQRWMGKEGMEWSWSFLPVFPKWRDICNAFTVKWALCISSWFAVGFFGKLNLFIISVILNWTVHTYFLFNLQTIFWDSYRCFQNIFHKYLVSQACWEILVVTLPSNS